MTEKEMIEELNDIISEEYNNGCDEWYSIAETVYNAGYRNCKDKVVLTRKEWARLRNLEINYNDAYDNFLLENAELIKRVQELEDRMAKSMLGCEFLPDCTIEERKRVVSDVVNEIKAFVYNNDGLMEKINNIAKKYGVE